MLLHTMSRPLQDTAVRISSAMENGPIPLFPNVSCITISLVDLALSTMPKVSWSTIPGSHSVSSLGHIISARQLGAMFTHRDLKLDTRASRQSWPITKFQCLCPGTSSNPSCHQMCHGMPSPLIFKKAWKYTDHKTVHIQYVFTDEQL